MGVKDYDLNPDNNTQINGINIAEGCPPSGINNAVRQLMADVKADSDAQNEALKNFSETPASAENLGPVKVGDGLSMGKDGTLSANLATAKAAGRVKASKTAQAGAVPVGGADGTLDKGWFGTLPDDIAAVSDNVNALANVAEVVNSSGDNWIRYKSGIQLCWGDGMTNASGGVTITLHVPYTNNVFSVSLAIAGNSGSLAAQIALYVERNSSKSFTVWAATGGKPAPGAGFLYFTIGRWK